MKRCPRCEVEKPATEFHVRRDGDKTYSQAYCKSCIRDYKARWERPAPPREQRACTRCYQVKDLDGFYQSLQHGRPRYECIACSRERQRLGVVRLDPAPFAAYIRRACARYRDVWDADRGPISYDFIRALVTKAPFGNFRSWEAWCRRTVAGEPVSLRHADAFAIAVGLHLSAFDPYYATVDPHDDEESEAA